MFEESLCPVYLFQSYLILRTRVRPLLVFPSVKVSDPVGTSQSGSPVPSARTPGKRRLETTFMILHFSGFYSTSCSSFVDFQVFVWNDPSVRGFYKCRVT